MRKLQSILAIALVLFNLSIGSVFAEDVTIENNGSSSNNTVNNTENNNNNVSQTNQAEIINEATTTSNTGNNSAISNTGQDTTISTGEVKSETKIKNSVNTSNVTSDCCKTSEGGNITISDNGTNSQNNVSSTQNNQNNVSIGQDAESINNISGNSNSGNNDASFNGGNVLIQTGNVYSKNQIINYGINNSNVSIPAGTNGTFNIKIAGNGAGSVNNTNNTQNNVNLVTVLNNAQLFNVINFNANSGNNKAQMNSGNVAILTGDVWLDNLILNDKINSSTVTINCGCLAEVPPTGGPTPPGGPGGGGGGGGGGDNGGGGSSGSSSGAAGASTGPGLPATGDNSLIWLTLALLATFIFGLKLTLKTNPYNTAWVYNRHTCKINS